MNEEALCNKLRSSLPNLETSRLLALLEARDQTLQDPSKDEDEKAKLNSLEARFSLGWKKLLNLEHAIALTTKNRRSIMKSWSYTVGYALGFRETIEAATEQEARNKIFDLHGDRRIYPVAGRWGVAVDRSVNKLFGEESRCQKN